MAERRMFANKVISSDDFLDMPATTQLLYFHLGMRADDDGFVGSPRAVMRMIGASNDDLKLLCAKDYIIPFKSGIVLVTHWKINNYIQKDRYHETVYLSEKQGVTAKENGMYTSCIQNVYISDTEGREGKSSIGGNPYRISPTNTGEWQKSKAGDAALNGRPPVPFPIDPDAGEYIDREGNA